jgi:predicted site-specific integrase-resolvase
VQAEQPKLLRVSRPTHELGLHSLTVRTWIKQGMIQAARVGNEVRMVQRSEIERLVGRTDGRLIVLYGRVSRQGQSSDLDTQFARLQVWAKHERVGKQKVVLSDIGSGLSATRRQLQQLLGLVRADQVAEIVVTYPDRLTRFGQEYLQALFESFGVALTVLASSEDKTAVQQLTDDLLAELASFSGRLYGMRSHKQQELLTCTQAVLTNS